jgi:putative FmdB family regulatory protein
VPTYQYTCTECAEPLEVVQSFSDDALTECPSCGGKLRKLYNAVGIVFKGSGFYRTDSRSGTSSSLASGDSSSSSSSSTSSSSDSGSGSGSGSGSDPGSSGSGSSDSSGTTPSKGGSKPSSTSAPASA